MIWGMTLHPGVEYTREITRQEYLTLASLDCRPRMSEGESNLVAHLVVKSDSWEHVLCTLEKGLVHQQNLDFILQKGDNLTLIVEGTGIVHISGYALKHPSVSDGRLTTGNETTLVRAVPDEIQDGWTPTFSTNAEGSQTEIIDEDCVSEIGHTHRTTVGVSDISYPKVGLEKVSDNKINSGNAVITDDLMQSTTYSDDFEKVRTRTPAGNMDTDLDKQSSWANTVMTKYRYDGTSSKLMESVKQHLETYSRPNTAKTVDCANREQMKMKPGEQGQSDRYNTQLTGMSIAQRPLRGDPTDVAYLGHNGTLAVRETTGGVKVNLESTDKESSSFHYYSANAARESTMVQQTLGCEGISEDSCDAIVELPIGYLEKEITKPFQCTLRETLRRHGGAVISETILKCKYCGEMCNCETSLIAHERQHLDPKRYKCSYCDKKFVQRNHLKDHERIHTGEKPFTCQYCQKKFNRKTYLMRHERIHTGQRPYQCNYCEKRFSQNTHLKEHERIHTGEKPFTCSYCGKKFNRKTYLMIHERIHTGQRPYKCKYCGRNFSQSSHLKGHEKTHAGKS